MPPSDQRDPVVVYKMSQYLRHVQDYLKSLQKVKNLAEERESKMELMLQVAKRNNLAEFEEKGVGLMLGVRRTCERLAKEIRKGQMTAVNEEFRGWGPQY